MSVCAIYVRLSEEDQNKVDILDDSESIKNQKSLLINYAMKSDMDVYDIYSDDNYSGMDANRPDFNRLIDDAKEGRFDTILCKNQSRFSRDMEMIEKYVNGIFIELGIRMIYVADYIDTSQPGSRKSVQINGLINEWYLEDLSNNVREGMHTMMKQGKYVSSFTPYGYKKDPHDKYHLIPDEPAAKIVRMIFQMYLDGNGYNKICIYLNELEIPTPTKYKMINGSNFVNSNVNKIYSWTPSTIGYILKHEAYIGSVVQGVRKILSYKTKKSKKLNKSDWIIAENMHEAIVSKEDFYKAQEMISKKKITCEKKNKNPVLFTGKLICGHCKRALRYSRDKYVYYFCPINVVDKKTCAGAYISENKLNEEVITQLKIIIDKYLDELQLSKTINGYRENQIKELKNEISKLNLNIQHLNDKKKNLYIDKVYGNITEQEYESSTDIIKKKMQTANQHLVELQKSINSDERNQTIEFLNKYKDIQKLDRGLIDELIEKIEVKNGPTKNIQIFWRF